MLWRCPLHAVRYMLWRCPLHAVCYMLWRCPLHAVGVLQVLIHGTEEATSSLAEFCHSTGVVQGNVFCPSVGDVIDATTERQIYQVSRPSVCDTQSIFPGPGNQPLATPPPELGRECVHPALITRIGDRGNGGVLESAWLTWVSHARTHTHTHARTHTRTHTHTHAYTHTHARIHAHARTHTYTHTHARTHEHTHTHTLNL